MKSLTMKPKSKNELFVAYRIFAKGNKKSELCENKNFDFEKQGTKDKRDWKRLQSTILLISQSSDFKFYFV